MANAKEIKRRMKSIKNTQQITKAMKMVAAAKLRRTQGAVLQSRPYTDKMLEIINRIMSTHPGIDSPLMEVREEVRKTAFLVISADRGLAGGYNANLMKLAMQEYNSCETEEKEMFVVGRKATAFLRARGYSYTDLNYTFPDVPVSLDANAVIDRFVSGFFKKEFDEVKIIYMKFRSAITHIPTVENFLPLAMSGEGDGTLDPETKYIFEPDAQTLLDELLPRFLKNQAFEIILNAKASEHGARMTAMGSATDNAGEMLDRLELSYNRARQAAITTEITEIVSGANALNG